MGLSAVAAAAAFYVWLPLACAAGAPFVGEIPLGFQASQTEWADQGGRFLLSNNSAFALCFYTGVDVATFVLVVIHVNSSKVVWTANRRQLISKSDEFVFGGDGNVYLRTESGGLAWSTDTAGKNATAMALRDSGNLVLIGDDGGRILWQSFGHPTDTLLPGQEFTEGMRLKSFPNRNNLSLNLEIKSGDLVLYGGFQTPQTYWSISSDTRRTNTSVTGKVHSVSLASNSWNFYDRNNALLWQFVFSESSSRQDDFWAAILGSDGSITFNNLHQGKSVTAESIRIPQNSCGVPENCDPYYVCYFENWCQCPPPLSARFGCKLPTVSACGRSIDQVELFYVGEKLDYFAIPFVAPALKTDVNACIEACRANCSCNVLFFDSSSGNCFLFDEIGNYERSDPGSNGYVSYMKISSASSTKGAGDRKKKALWIAFGAISTIAIVGGLIYIGLLYRRRRRDLNDYRQEDLDDDNFLDGLSGMPVRFSYTDLSQATNNFSTKVGQGGFGSVYQGVLPDGTRLAVKKLEGIGQGKKEFRAEVSTIGSIHHLHLVKLKGFCAEGAHRLLVYEFMSNGSLDRWIFKSGEACLDWNARYSIALGTAKGLAYLHEECEGKIVHCDIKPENVLLDDRFVAKVSDFGLAKLMSREESLVYTTLRGTRGYLAPEWITNNPISEKSDVYSYGMVLLEIIGGRKNYDPGQESPGKVHFPSYAFSMLEEGRIKEIVDPRMDDADDERVTASVKVALWCVQDEMHMRPPMTKVVQMLEGLCDVPRPPVSGHLGSWTGPVEWSSSGTSSGLMDWSSNALLSGVRLSGPR